MLPRVASCALALGLVLVASSRARADPPRGDGSAAATRSSDVSFIGPAGVLAAGKNALFVSGDTELPGYPAVEAGWRYGIAGIADVGIEAQAIDVAGLGRVHGKIRLFEDRARRGFIGLRLRVDFKRQVQKVDPDTFRDIDDFGFVIAPELSAALRFGERREHALYYFTYPYIDLDVRSDAKTFECYYAPILLGYEYHHPIGFHVLADAGVGWEIGNPDTFAELIPRFRLRLGWEL